MPKAIRLPRALFRLIMLPGLLLAVGCVGAAAPGARHNAPDLGGETVRMLIVGDPFSGALRALATQLGSAIGVSVRIEVVSYDDLRKLTLRNACDLASAYDHDMLLGILTPEQAAAQAQTRAEQLFAARATTAPGVNLACAPGE
jgi:hypothetical protein